MSSKHNRWNPGKIDLALSGGSARGWAHIGLSHFSKEVAFVVCQSIGLDTNTAFSDYIQLYKGDTETLINSIQPIKNVSGKILSGLT